VWLPDRRARVPSDALTGALVRATCLLARLDVARRPADVEAAVSGLRHELRTALRAVGLDPEEVLEQGRRALDAPSGPPADGDTPPQLPFPRPD
jgi:hypothetical protein